MSEIMLGVLLIFAFPVISIVALVMTMKARESVQQLQGRVAALEAGLPAWPIAALPSESTPAVPTAVEPPPVVEQPTATPWVYQPPPPARAFAPASPVAPATAEVEEIFGAQWVVWIGGLALALGGIFLVRYSIEQGLIGPGVRI